MSTSFGPWFCCKLASGDSWVSKSGADPAISCVDPVNRSTMRRKDDIVESNTRECCSSGPLKRFLSHRTWVNCPAMVVFGFLILANSDENATMIVERNLLQFMRRKRKIMSETKAMKTFVRIFAASRAAASKHGKRRSKVLIQNLNALCDRRTICT